MGARKRELLILLALCALVCSEPVNKTKKESSDNELDQYEDYDDDTILYSEGTPCPRDCICTVSQAYRIAKCSRLEVGTQKFGKDITDLVIENADPRFPIKLEEYIFVKLGLNQISTVKIVNSSIESVAPKAFYGLNELYAVNLSGNNLRTLDPETFAYNKKLLLLTLANNPLKFPAARSNDYFLNASAVQELVISNCNMQYITANTFNNMTSLMYLNVAGNNLNDIHPEAFKRLLDLEEIDLSDNNIKSLPDDIFSENTEVSILHIQKNPIDTVYGLQITDLLTLNAGQTNIKFVGPSMFNGMKYLANLNLSGNGIEKIHNQAFHKLNEMNYLDLSYNNLDLISNILIKENIELEIFKISNNPKLKHLPERGFNCSADQFNIYLFDASNCGLEEIYDNSLSTFTALSQINLAANKIKTISPQVFSFCPKIVQIDLSDNLLTVLDNKVFAKNKELGKLNLRGNPLHILSMEIFVPTPALSWLDVSHADLTSLWKEDKNHPTNLLNKLKFLNISHNRINEIKLNEVETFKELMTFDISNNPLVCSREYESLMIWLNNNTVSPTANTMSIANLEKDTKEDITTNNSWEVLSQKICGYKPEPLSNSVTDEEIWERITKDEGNFDLKDTLDDAKFPDDSLSIDEIKAIDNNTSDEDDKADDDEDDDESEDDNSNDDEEDDTNFDDDMDINVKLIEKPSKTEEPLPPLLKEGIQIKLQLDDEYLHEDSEPKVRASIISEHGRYDYFWPILIALSVVVAILVAIAMLVMIVCKRNRQMRYNSAIIAAINNSARTKKDCGLIYQPLTEDLVGPATPKFPRYQPLPVTVQASNMSYESSPFHHNKIVPEAV